jgi:predicted acetyltransferase
VDTDIDVTEMAAQEDTTDLYEEFSVPFNGYIIREARYQLIKIEECLKDGGKAYLFTKGAKKLGYALTEDQGGKVQVNELIACNAKGAAAALYEKIGKPIEFMSPYPIDAMEAEIKPHCMARITDIEGVFDGIKAKEHSMLIKVTDDIIKENNGVFAFDSQGGTLHVYRTKDRAQTELSIKDLAAIALGYDKSMSARAIEIYKAYFGKNRPWIVEVC